MPAIVSWLESEGVVRGRIRVVCEGKPQLDGYIAEFGQGWDSQSHVVITKDISKASRYQRSLRGTFPKRVCQMDFPTLSAVDGTQTPSSRPAIPVASRMLGPADPVGPPVPPPPVVVPQPSSWSAVFNRVLGRDQAVQFSARQLAIWLDSDDGDLFPSRSLERPSSPAVSAQSPAREQLLPVVLSGFTTSKLIFCPDSTEVGNLPVAHLKFEDIDSNPRF
ncbi:hypothetical protein FRC01_010872 [Tulasnella sp. 417]|nr:hypothetical protein FRC01_010872 [Tulasnella sp. 417]